MNLLRETLDKMDELDVSADDIFYIGSYWGVYSCDWTEFCVLANREYNNLENGIQQVAEDLMIFFGKKGRIVRVVKQGREGWDFMKPIKVVLDRPKVSSLFRSDKGSRLAEINKSLFYAAGRGSTKMGRKLIG